MEYLKVNIERNNTIEEISKQPFSGTTKDGVDFSSLSSNEIQVQSDFNFPSLQPPYFYRWNGSDVEENSSEYIIIFRKGLRYFKIYDFMNNIDYSEYNISPLNYDFNILGLNKLRTFNKGELNKIDYYSNVTSGGTYQDLVLTEYREYFRKDRMVYKRKLDIVWYYNDETTGATKTTYKHYSAEESIKLGETRRRNVISDLKIGTIGLIQLISGLSQTEATMIGMVFLSKVTDEITQYIEGIEDPLKNFIMTYSGSDCLWLDDVIPNTGGLLVRQYLYNAVDLDYTDNIG